METNAGSRSADLKETATIVIFGASGDLTARKLVPALYALWKNGYLSDEAPIVGVARRDKSDESFRAEMFEAVQKAAADANAVQDAVNLVAVIGCFHRHLLALSRRGVSGDDLINHPVAIAFTSKLNSLCRMNLDREMKAFDALSKLERGEQVEYEVIPL